MTTNLAESRVIAYIDHDWFLNDIEPEWHLPTKPFSWTNIHPYLCGKKLDKPPEDYALSSTYNPNVVLCPECQRIKTMRSLAE